MRHRFPVAVATALILTGCALPGSSGGKVPLQTKVVKVQAMTKTFSVSTNPGLNKAAMSVKELATALRGAFAVGAGALAPTGAASVDMTAALGGARAAGMRAAYELSGVANQGDAVLTYDDETGEVTAIEGKNAKITFAFKNDGKRRTWDAVIVKSPDGTTGRFHIEVTGTWRPNALIALMGGMPVAPRRDLPPAGADAERALPAMPSFAKPTYTWLNNEIPEAIDDVKVTLDVLPKGDASLAFKLDGTFNKPQAVPGTAMRVPTHWVYSARIPKVSLDWESTLTLAAGKSTFDARGTMNVEADAGPEQFSYELRADEKDRLGYFAMTNVNAKVKLQLAATEFAVNSRPQVVSTLLSTEDDSQIGVVALDPKRPRF
ncbi:MAG: hypothetical protein ACK46X_18600, partial [Candidatus Sericytochromatia bacterium]